MLPERRELPALVLEAVLGHLGPQRGRDVLREELPYFGHPCALGIIELEVHKATLTTSCLLSGRTNLNQRLETGRLGRSAEAVHQFAARVVVAMRPRHQCPQPQ